MHGLERIQYTHMAETAAPGASRIKVAAINKPLLDAGRAIRTGDQIAIAPTEYWYQHTEYRTVESVSDAGDGSGFWLELDEPLAHRHIGDKLVLDDLHNYSGLSLNWTFT